MTCFAQGCIANATLNSKCNFFNPYQKLRYNSNQNRDFDTMGIRSAVLFLVKIHAAMI